MEDNIKKSYIKLIKSSERGTDVFKIKFENNDFVISYDIDEVGSMIEQKRFKMITANGLDNIEEQTPIFYVELLDNVIIESECINYSDVDLVDVLLYKETVDSKKYRR